MLITKKLIESILLQDPEYLSECLDDQITAKALIKTRRSVEHCNPHADGAWLNELGWSRIIVVYYVTGSEKRYIVAHIFKIELLAPRGRVSSQL